MMDALTKPLSRSTSVRSEKSSSSSSATSSLDDQLSSLFFSIGTASAQERAGGKKMVRFSNDDNEEIVIESVPLECHKDVFYSALELEKIRSQDIAEIQNAHGKLGLTNLDDINFDSITWRGLEDFQFGNSQKNKNARVTMYRKSLLQELSFQSSAGDRDDDELRRFSKYLSKRDRVKASKRGYSDAQAALGIRRAFAWRVGLNVTTMTFAKPLLDSMGLTASIKRKKLAQAA